VPDSKYEQTSEQQYRFGMPGPQLTQRDLARWLEAVDALDPPPDYVVASGSLPPGVPEDFYATMRAHLPVGAEIDRLRGRGRSSSRDDTGDRTVPSERRGNAPRTGGCRKDGRQGLTGQPGQRSPNDFFSLLDVHVRVPSTCHRTLVTRSSDKTPRTASD